MPVDGMAVPGTKPGDRGHDTFDGTDWTDCTDCDLHGSRTQIVVYRGTLEADVVFVGEAPGRQEDEQGRPFVGRSGELLDRWIDRMGLDRWCITNLVRCRPPDNRDPKAAERDACGVKLLTFLDRVDPAVVVALGRHAHGWLEAHDVDHEYIYHPAYFLRGLAKWPPAVDELAARIHDRLKDKRPSGAGGD